MSCGNKGKWFKSWCSACEDIEGLFAVRDIQTNKLWSSRELRGKTGALPLADWCEDLRHVTDAQAQQIEDAHSRALKTGQPADYRVEARYESGTLKFEISVEPHYCQCSGQGKCAVMLCVFRAGQPTEEHA